MGQSNQWPALLSKISSPDDALKIIRETAILIVVLAVIQAVTDYIVAPAWVNTRLVLPLLLISFTFGLWLSRSLVFAAMLLLIFLLMSITFVTMRQTYQVITEAIADGSLSILGLLASICAVIATSSLTRQITATEAMGSSPSTAPAATGALSPLSSLIQQYPLVEWLTILFPPFLFVPLFFSPIDMSGAIFLWLAALIAFPISLWHIIKFAIGRSGDRPLSFKAFVRPTLTILIIIAAPVFVMKSRHSADEFGRSLARLAQEQCKANGACPTSLREFTCSERTYRDDKPCQFSTQYGEYGAQFAVSYLIPKDKKAFWVKVRHDIDSDLVLTGGVEAELTEKISNH